jgi:hypothetical protein
LMRRQVLLPALLVAGLVACGEKEEPAAPIPEGPVEWEVAATADKSEIQVGEDLAVPMRISSYRPALSSSPSSSSSGSMSPHRHRWNPSSR